MHFYSFEILKRISDKNDDPIRKRYNNVCFILDDDLYNEVCTTEDNGFTMDDMGDVLTWRIPKRNTKKVSIVFRQQDAAQIAEVKLFHIPEGVEIWNGKRDDVIQWKNVNGGQFEVMGQKWAESYMFDDDSLTWWHSESGISAPKTLRFTFEQPTHFLQIVIMKRILVNNPLERTRYKDVCLGETLMRH